MYPEEQIHSLLKQYYNLSGELKALAGEVDHNYYFRTGKGEEYTVKISPPGTDIKGIQFQIAIMDHLLKKELPYQIPKPLLTIKGEAFIQLENASILRLQKWVPGRMIADIIPKTADLLSQWGKLCAGLSLSLQDFFHPYADRFYKWDPAESLYSKKYRKYIDKDKLKLADYFWDLFENRALPVLPELRKSVNYNDAHEHNLLANKDLKSPKITGLIDFGDGLHTHTISELAIACAYAAMNWPDPISAWKKIIRAYHEVFPIEEKELKVLFPLIAARLMITVSNSAYQRNKEPENEYLSISEKAAWDLLQKMEGINPALAEYSFLSVCGFNPLPHSANLLGWINDPGTKIHPVMDLSGKKLYDIDLSVGSCTLGNYSHYSSMDKLEKRINSILEENASSIGKGGYGEIRPFYTNDLFSEEGNEGLRWRTVHLGIDIWSMPGSDIFAPLDAMVYGLTENAGDLNYGPTLILEHESNEGQNFYTLYGHLDPECLENLEVGHTIIKGERIAKIGGKPRNGNWPPHLHFQLILDMMNYKDDFPGLSYFDDKDIWMALSPDPSPFLGLKKSSVSQSAVGLQNNDQLKERRKLALGQSLSLSYDDPVQIVRGSGQYLYSISGRRYLDTVNNVAHVGHEHPNVVMAAQKQMAVLNTNTRYLHPKIIEYAEELLKKFPKELDVVYFVNSGSEANELAMRMVEAYNGSRNMIAVQVAYHGNTGACIDISSYKFDGKSGKGAPVRTQVVPIPDIYRGLYRNEETAGKLYADHIKEAIAQRDEAGKKTGAFICESILSCGGQVVLPKDYLKHAYHYVREAGGLCIADEVQVGFGRVGDTYWGFELQGVVPDIVTLGKPIGNGHPLAAVVVTKEVANAFNNGMEYFNTYGGNPVSAAIGLEVLSIIDGESLQENARKIGNHLKRGLLDLMEDHHIIGDVRGHGFFLGFELVKNRRTFEPAGEEAAYLINRMKERGILMSADGPDHNVLKIKPPMCFDKKNADFLLDNLNLVFRDDFLRK